MTTTRSMTRAGALQHILYTIFQPEKAALIAFFSHTGANDIDDFMSITEDIFHPGYFVEDQPDKEIFLKIILVNKLTSLQQWFVNQEVQEVESWFTITLDIFSAFRKSKVTQRFNPTSNIPVTPTPTTQTFRSSIKINIADYSKLKEDSQWRSFNRQLRATAANHDTLEILDLNYVPTLDIDNLFQQKQKFMYNVFSQCLVTSKDKVCVRAHEKDMDAQQVYAQLLDAYDDQISTSLDATSLRSELTLMKLDDKWRKGYETFLTFWSSKVQELESIEDKSIDDDTKRIWLTNTLQSHKDMNSAVRQAITTELTFSGMNKTSSTKQVSWCHFYRIVLSTAKMLDNSRAQGSNQPREVNTNTQQRGNIKKHQNAHSRQSGRNGKSNTSQRQYTTYAGPNMQMESNMSFHPDDWKNKLSSNQKSKLIELKKQAKNNRNNSSSLSFNVHQTETESSSAHSAATVPSSNTGINIRHALSNGSARTTYSCACTYSINQHESKASGALIDGGANGGMSGSDMRLVSETYQTADITGIGEKSINNLPVCTMAALITTNKGPIIGIFNQYANYGKGLTVHSVNQLKQFGILIDDTPRCLHGGKQRLEPQMVILFL